MITTWALYAVLVSTLFGLSALALERALMAGRLPARGIWVVSLLASCVFAGYALVAPRTVAAPLPSAVAAGASAPILTPAPARLGGEALAAAASVSHRPELGVALLAAWLLLSGGLALALVVARGRLALRRRRWRCVRIDAVDVLISTDTGPAVLGFRRPVIVLPEWALSLPAEDRDLLLAHEREHAGAGDNRVLGLGLLTLLAMPWNAALWWQFGRLRRAVEIDCDARVARATCDLRRYGELLIRVGARRGGRLELLATFAEPVSLLESRLRALTAAPVRHRVLRVSVAVALATVGLVLACETPRPLVETGQAAADDEGFELSMEFEVSEGDVGRAVLSEAYPELLTAQPRGEQAVVYVLVDRGGSILSKTLRWGPGASDDRPELRSVFPSADPEQFRTVGSSYFAAGELSADEVLIHMWHVSDAEDALYEARVLAAMTAARALYPQEAAAGLPEEQAFWVIIRGRDEVQDVWIDTAAPDRSPEGLQERLRRAGVTMRHVIHAEGSRRDNLRLRIVIG
jgi:beta-lactamase regulating signal transducer with metallopeptidase domain